jgi:uncharacterized membrane protein HdeD (DUF308 family)
MINLIFGVICVSLGLFFCYWVADTMLEVSYWCGVVMCMFGGHKIGKYIFNR